MIKEVLPLLPNSQILNSERDESYKCCETLWVVARLSCGIFSDILLLPFAAGLLATAKLGYNFNPNPEDIKKGKTPIVLLHGNYFNESEFVVGRYFLNKEQYGSVFSFNLEGYLSIDKEKGIDDHAYGKAREKIKEITKITECNSVILLGHSMGGVIATFYAENIAEEDEIEANHVFTVDSPVKGTPTLDFIWTNISENIRSIKRMHQMSISGGKSVHKGFAQNLSQQAWDSEAKGIRNYYSIHSLADWAVPFESGMLTKIPDRVFTYNYLGHYGPIADPRTWIWVNSHMDTIYKS